VPNPFAPIDRLDFDFDLPPLPAALGRADRWFDRMSEVQRIGAVFLLLLFLAAAALYCLGLGSTVVLNRAEASLAEAEAQAAAQQPVIGEPTPLPDPTPTLQPTLAPTLPPTRAPAKPTALADLPTPIPAQLLPTVPLQPQAPPRVAAPVEQPARPRLVAPVEPPTPTPPIRTTAPAAKPTVAAPASAPIRGATPTTKPGSVFITPAPAATSRPVSTSAPAAKPGTAPVTKPTSAPVVRPTAAPAIKPTSAPIFGNPIGPTPRPNTTR
jgi:hypothetical protein